MKKRRLNVDKVKGKIVFIGNWFIAIAIGKRRSTFETCCKESLRKDENGK